MKFFSSRGKCKDYQVYTYCFKFLFVEEGGVVDVDGPSRLSDGSSSSSGTDSSSDSSSSSSSESSDSESG